MKPNLWEWKSEIFRSWYLIEIFDSSKVKRGKRYNCNFPWIMFQCIKAHPQVRTLLKQKTNFTSSFPKIFIVRDVFCSSILHRKSGKAVGMRLPNTSRFKIPQLFPLDLTCLKRINYFKNTKFWVCQKQFKICIHKLTKKFSALNCKDHGYRRTTIYNGIKMNMLRIPEIFFCKIFMSTLAIHKAMSRHSCSQF